MQRHDVCAWQLATTWSNPKEMAMGRKSNGGDRGNVYDRRERKLWLIGARQSAKYGPAPFGGDGTQVPCVHCTTSLTMETLEADRIVPGSRGGTYRWDNIQPSCRSCNASRGDGVA